MSDLAAALMIAIRTHAGQTDKQGEPYLLHVLRVVEAVSVRAKVVAALHDVLEDSLEHNRLGVQALGLKLLPCETLAIELVSRPLGISYDQYIRHIARPPRSLPTEALNRKHAGRLAREVKLADLRDNLGRMPAATRDLARRDKLWGYKGGLSAEEWASLARRYEKAIAILEAAEVGT